jgi:hypothetical protein
VGFFDNVGNTPSARLCDYTWMLYGAPGIGKTTFAAEGDYLLLAFERGYTAMEANAIDLTSAHHPDPQATPDAKTTWKRASVWARFGLTIQQIVALDRLPWAGVCLDTVDQAYLACQELVCAERDWAHPDDGGDYGKGYAAINQTFQGRITTLIRHGVPLGFTSHSRSRGFSGRGGVKFDKIIPTLPPSAAKWVIGICDLVLFADAVPGPDGKALRVAHTQPSFRFDAKARGRRGTPLPTPLLLDFASFARVFAQTMQGQPVSAEDLPVVSEIETRPQQPAKDEGAPWPS